VENNTARLDGFAISTKVVKENGGVSVDRRRVSRYTVI